MLLPPPPAFTGFPSDAFEAFSVRDRDERRRAIIAAFHPGLKLLSEDLLLALNDGARRPFHAHLPQLNWPKGYVPFCTWLALSTLPHGYQAGPQLNIGVHADFVAARLAWDTAADGFGRFEFRARVAGLHGALTDAASANGLSFRVYAAAPWPEGSHLVFESTSDWEGAFAEVKRRGVWWEIGRRFDLPESRELIASPQLSTRIVETLVPLRALYETIDD